MFILVVGATLAAIAALFFRDALRAPRGVAAPSPRATAGTGAPSSAPSFADQQERQRRAAAFCGTSYLFAIGVTHPLVDRLGTVPVGLAITKRGLEYWNLFVMSAAAFVVLSVIEDELPTSDYDSLKTHLFRATDGAADEHVLHLWSMNGTAAVEDCAGFVERALTNIAQGDAKQVLAFSLGAWILWNILGREPAAKEQQLASAVGHAIATAYAPFWNAAA